MLADIRISCVWSGSEVISSWKGNDGPLGKDKQIFMTVPQNPHIILFSLMLVSFTINSPCYSERLSLKFYCNNDFLVSSHLKAFFTGSWLTCWITLSYIIKNIWKKKKNKSKRMNSLDSSVLDSNPPAGWGLSVWSLHDCISKIVLHVF